MSKLNIDKEQNSIFALFSKNTSNFLIPDYQRPYAWGEAECQTLWEDIFAFAFPGEDYSNFKPDEDEYFLGSIVTFRNDRNQIEVIDGQQRLTTLMLLLRAFHKKFGNMKDSQSENTRKNLEKCIWKTDEFGNPKTEELKIYSEVATDNDKDEFLNLLKTGELPEKIKSRYARNYRFFQEQINNFVQKYPNYFAYLPMRILNNCILLPIEADSQDTALRIFSTLNDRGLPLSDADIFKAQFYKYYSKNNKKEEFVKSWKELEELSNKIFHPISGTPMDELFTRYMYFERAKCGETSSTTVALRKFYEKNKYELLQREETFENLKKLAKFWNDVSNQEKDRFSEKVLQRLFVLNYAPNGMWNYFVSVYFMQNKDNECNLEDEPFCDFLSKITGFIFAYAVTNPGVNALRTPVYTEMRNIVNGKDVDFANSKFDPEKLRPILNEYEFKNNRPITKSILAWWAFNTQGQELLSLETVFEIEHIYAKKRQEIEQSLSSEKQLESLGNKVLLEKRINIRASEYKFADKTKFYRGFINNKRQQKEGTHIKELLDLSNRTDYTEEDIVKRHDHIIDEFIKFLEQNNLLEK